MKGAAEVGGTAAEDRLPPIKPRSTPPTTTRPFRPPLVKRNNNNNKDDVHVRPSQAPTTSSTWPPPGEVGMHDARFYEEVAHELSLDAPVLHSVIHTHKWLNEKPRTTANTTAGSSSTNNNNNNNTQPNDDVVKKDDDDVVEEGISPIDALRAQIDAIGDDVHRWKVGRLADAAQDSSAKDAEASMQNAMDARLFHKRSEEQDRAMRRIREIVNRVGDQLDVARSKITKFGADVCCNEEEKRQRVEENVDANLRLALDRHDRERDERVAHRLTEVRSFTQSWLVERDLQRKYEERQSCLRQHWLDGYDIHQEEERERRGLRAAYLTEKCTVGLMTDETCFREGLVMDEAARRCAIVGKREDVLEAILQRHAAASNKAEDDAVDEDEDDDDDDDEGEDENADDDDDVLEVEAPTQVAPQSQPPTTTTSMASPPSDMRLDEDCPKTIVTHLRPVEELSMTNTISGGVSSPPPPAGDDDDNAGARDEAHEENDDGNDDDHHHHHHEEEVALPPQPSEAEPHNAEMVPVASTNPLDSPAVVQSSKENSLTEDGAMLSDHASTEPYDELHSSRRMARLEEDESVDVEE